LCEDGNGLSGTAKRGRGWALRELRSTSGEREVKRVGEERNRKGGRKKKREDRCGRKNRNI